MPDAHLPPALAYHCCIAAFPGFHGFGSATLNNLDTTIDRAGDRPGIGGSRMDSEVGRFLEFERWRGGLCLFNATIVERTLEELRRIPKYDRVDERP